MTIAWLDMKQQVVPLMLQWREIITGNSSMFLNTLSTGGTGFWGIFFFFISSPFSLLIFIVNKADSILFMNIMVAGKIALSALTVSILFRKSFNKTSEYYILLLSLIYAFSGFTLMFYQNILWLDFVILFPILLLGLLRVFEKEKYAVYFFSLITMLISSYYLSYMVVIFVVLFTFVFLIKPKPNTKAPSIIVITSLLAVGVTAFVWLPSLFEFFNSARTVNIWESLRSGFFTSYFETTAGIVLSSSIFLTLIPLMFLKINKINMKISRFVLLFTILLLPLFIEPINKMWHTGSYQAFPARYGYITILIGLFTIGLLLDLQSSKVQEKEDKITKNKIIFSFLSIILVITCVIYSLYLTENKLEDISSYSTTLWGSQTSFILLLSLFVLFGVVFSLLFILKHFKNIPKNVFNVLILILVVSEIFFNLNVYLKAPSNSTWNYENIFDLEKRVDDDDFYRMKVRYKFFDVNLTGALGYNSLATYTSLTPESYLYSMKKLGYSSYWMEVNSSHGTAFIDSLMVNKYTIGRPSENLYLDSEIIYWNSEYSISKNKTLDNPAFFINEKQYDLLKSIDNKERIQFQNYLYKALSEKNDDLFNEYSPAGTENVNYSNDDLFIINKINDDLNGFIEYQVYVKDKQILYFDLFDKVSAHLVENINDSVNVYVNDYMLHSVYPNKNSNGILDLGEFSEEFVKIKIEILKDIKASSFGVFGLKTNTLEDFLFDFNKTNVVGSFIQDENKIFLKDISKEKGFLALTFNLSKDMNVFVDGKRVQPLPFLDGFTAIPIDNNSSDVEIIYIPFGFKAGVIISLVTLLIIFLYLFYYKLISKIRGPLLGYLIKDKLNFFIKILVLSVCFIVIFMVYIFPTFYYIYYQIKV